MMRRWAAPILLAVLGCGDGVGPQTGVGNFVHVSTGTGHTCAVRSTGEVYCWGLGDESRLGSEGGSTFTPRRAATEWSMAPAPLFTSATLGLRHSCALGTQGEAVCWGWNHFGQLGIGSHVTAIYPVLSAQDLRFARLSAGWQHTCGITLDGEGWCWGMNGQGQLGNGTTEDSPVALRVSLAEPLIAIGAGAAHTCAVTADRRAFCWGSNASGQLGDATWQNSAQPVEVVGGLPFAQIDAGFAHTCALTQDGRAYCWGSNSYGELGLAWRDIPGSPGVPNPAEVFLGFEPGLRLATISAGHFHSCAVGGNATGYCWGRGLWGQNGHGHLRDEFMPRRVPMPVNVRFTGISTGAGLHVCAVSERAAAYCWGTSESGALGSQGVVYSLRPVLVGAR